jgi:hypothetical protein
VGKGNIYFSIGKLYKRRKRKTKTREEQIMFEETTSKTVKSIKWVWWFLKEELPQFLSNWRTVPRIMMVLYGLVFYNTMQWFMALDAPNNAQAGFVSVVVGAGAAWFGLYVNGKSSKVQSSKEPRR